MEGEDQRWLNSYRRPFPSNNAYPFHNIRPHILSLRNVLTPSIETPANSSNRLTNDIFLFNAVNPLRLSLRNDKLHVKYII